MTLEDKQMFILGFMQGVLSNQQEKSKKKELQEVKEVAETREVKAERLENALLEYIERHTKDTQPEIAATIPAAAMALVELWKTI